MFIVIKLLLIICGRYIQVKWGRVAESVLVAACSAIILVLLIYVTPDCQPIKDFHHPNVSTHDVNVTLQNDITEQHQLHRRSTDVSYQHIPSHGVNSSGGSEDDHHGGHSPYGLHGDHGYVFQVKHEIIDKTHLQFMMMLDWPQLYKLWFVNFCSISQQDFSSPKFYR